MKYLSLCLLLAATTVSAQTSSDKPGDKIAPRPITLTGCVAAGTEPDTYMLSNVRADSAVGATGSSTPDAIYWLTPHDKLKGHVGHQVRVVGVLDDNVKDTKVKTKDGKVELKQEGKKVEVPEGSKAGVAAGADDKARTRSVKMLSRSCPK